jgi:hypothetical protein
LSEETRSKRSRSIAARPPSARGLAYTMCASTTALKEVVADLTLENRLLKKSMIGDGECEA